MLNPTSTLKPELATPRPRDAVRSAAFWGGLGFGAVLLLAAIGLWVHYGTAVFFETIAAGFANCF